jgi:hypothetical protein
MVEEDDPVVLSESGPDVPPHALITSKAMREEHRSRSTRSVLDDVVAGQNSHGS